MTDGVFRIVINKRCFEKVINIDRNKLSQVFYASAKYASAYYASAKL